ncbi:uncharacterized protein LOC131210191 [Anopheles bellator]|uniref:uncharacterized protein LOC131210191 n=1 Tax=Anopheles bellator TaxID=139047 RepID=UPI002649010A|nr:uncharacterized protein LOC131210191 [Anopheles bellator]
MVLNATTKLFLLVVALFLTFVVGFFAYVLSLRHERARLWNEIERRGAARYTELGDINYWYFVVRDMDKIRNMTDIHYLERASHIVPVDDGFILVGKDYEIHYERIRPPKSASGMVVHHPPTHSPPPASPDAEDYMPTVVKRKLYAWEIGKPAPPAADAPTAVVRTRWKLGEHRIRKPPTGNTVLPFNDIDEGRNEQ